MSTRKLAAYVDDASFAHELGASARTIVGVKTSVRSHGDGTALLLLSALPGVALPDSAIISIATSTDGPGEERVAVALGSEQRDHGDPSATLLMEATEAQPIDMARLLGAVLRGQIHWDQLGAHLQCYWSLQVAGTELAGPSGSMEGLDRAVPWLMPSLRADLDDQPVLDRWGNSTTVEGTGGLMPTSLLEFLASHAGLPARADRCHSGIAHSYGYLLSPTWTTFGRKRHRWTSLEAAHTLGAAVPWPLGPPLGVLRAVTSVLSQVAPLDGHGPLPVVDSTRPAMAVRWERCDDGKAPTGSWRSRTRVLRRVDTADGVLEQGDELLLVYSLLVGNEPERYITAFPVSASFALGLMSAPPQGLRFNAVV